MFRRALIIAVVTVAPAVADATPIFSNVISNANEVSYDIGGTIMGSLDLLNAVTNDQDSSYPWSLIAFPDGFTFASLSVTGWSVQSDWRHVNSSSPLLSLATGLMPYGNEFSGLTAVSDDTGIDSFYLRLNVGIGELVEDERSISGRFAVVHRESPVTEPGTVALLCLGLVGACTRRLTRGRRARV